MTNQEMLERLLKCEANMTELHKESFNRKGSSIPVTITWERDEAKNVTFVEADQQVGFGVVRSVWKSGERKNLIKIMSFVNN